MNKSGGMSDLFIFMILAFSIVLICAIFIYLGGKAYSEIRTETLDMTGVAGNENITKIVDNTMGKVNTTYKSLYWISMMLIVGMVISIFISSYLVTTKPVFFIPYIFITIIAIIIAVGISNAYEEIIQDPTLASTFAGFVGSNYIMLQLPIWIAVIGVVGAIIMFVRMGSKENDIYGGYQ